MYYKVILEPDIESGGYVAYCPTLRGCVSEGGNGWRSFKKYKEGYKRVYFCSWRRTKAKRGESL